MKKVHEQVWGLTLEKEVHVPCVQAEVKPDTTTPSNAGALIPWSSWDDSHYMAATGATRWTIQGLMRVRPLVACAGASREAIEWRAAHPARPNRFRLLGRHHGEPHDEPPPHESTQ